MAIHGYPGGVVSATAPLVNPSFASGMWTLARQLYYQAQGVWPPNILVDYLVVAGGGAGAYNRGAGGGGAGGYLTSTGLSIATGLA